MSSSSSSLMPPSSAGDPSLTIAINEVKLETVKELVLKNVKFDAKQFQDALNSLYANTSDENRKKIIFELFNHKDFQEVIKDNDIDYIIAIINYFKGDLRNELLTQFHRASSKPILGTHLETAIEKMTDEKSFAEEKSLIETLFILNPTIPLTAQQFITALEKNNPSLVSKLLEQGVKINSDIVNKLSELMKKPAYSATIDVVMSHPKVKIEPLFLTKAIESEHKLIPKLVAKDVQLTADHFTTVINQIVSEKKENISAKIEILNNLMKHKDASKIITQTHFDTLFYNERFWKESKGLTILKEMVEEKTQGTDEEKAIESNIIITQQHLLQAINRDYDWQWLPGRIDPSTLDERHLIAAIERARRGDSSLLESLVATISQDEERFKKMLPTQKGTGEHLKNIIKDGRPSSIISSKTTAIYRERVKDIINELIKLTPFPLLLKHDTSFLTEAINELLNYSNPEFLPILVRHGAKLAPEHLSTAIEKLANPGYSLGKTSDEWVKEVEDLFKNLLEHKEISIVAQPAHLNELINKKIKINFIELWLEKTKTPITVENISYTIDKYLRFEKNENIIKILQRLISSSTAKSIHLSQAVNAGDRFLMDLLMTNGVAPTAEHLLIALNLYQPSLSFINSLLKPSVTINAEHIKLAIDRYVDPLIFDTLIKNIDSSQLNEAHVASVIKDGDKTLLYLKTLVEKNCPITTDHFKQAIDVYHNKTNFIKVLLAHPNSRVCLMDSSILTNAITTNLTQGRSFKEGNLETIELLIKSGAKIDEAVFSKAMEARNLPALNALLNFPESKDENILRFAGSALEAKLTQPSSLSMIDLSMIQLMLDKQVPLSTTGFESLNKFITQSVKSYKNWLDDSFVDCLNALLRHPQISSTSSTTTPKVENQIAELKAYAEQINPAFQAVKKLENFIESAVKENKVSDFSKLYEDLKRTIDDQIERIEGGVPHSLSKLVSLLANKMIFLIDMINKKSEFLANKTHIEKFALLRQNLIGLGCEIPYSLSKTTYEAFQEYANTAGFRVVAEVKMKAPTPSRSVEEANRASSSSSHSAVLTTLKTSTEPSVAASAVTSASPIPKESESKLTLKEGSSPHSEPKSSEESSRSSFKKN